MQIDVIHRVIEQQAARHGERPAIIDDAGDVSYSALNSRANALARVLMCAGLRRAGHAKVTGEPGSALAVALLAVLKAGASYSWSQGAETVSAPAIAIRQSDGEAADQYLVVEDAVPATQTQASPNLPVLVRGCDIACIVHSSTEGPQPVAHAAIAARLDARVSALASWTDDSTAAALWIALMTGATVTTLDRAAAA